VSSMAGAQQAADLAAQSAQQTVGTMQEAIAALLTTQLSEYDQRQSSIEEGLRALWGRLDQVDVALQDLGAGGGQATATELQEVLSSTLLGFSDHMTDRTAAVTSAAVGELVAGVPGEVTEAVTALTDLVTVVGEAVAGLPERIASLVSDRFADQMSVALRALPDELHDAVADLPAAVSARVEDSVGGLPDTIGDLLAQVSIQLTRKISDDLERLPEQVGARIAEELDHLPAAIAEHTAGRLAGAGGASQVDPEALEDMVHVAAERVGDTIAARLEATIAQVSGFVPDAVEQAARSIESSVRSGVAQSVATTLGQALDSLLGPSVEEAVEAALGARPASSGEVTTEMVLAAADAAASAAATAAASAASGAAATAAAHAAADAVSEAMTTLPAVSRAGTESPELTSGLISAVAGTIDDFGTQVDGALDEMASRIDSLSDGMQRLAAVLEDMLSRRRGPSTEAVTLLRQVAAEGAEAPMPPPRPPAAEPAPESAPSGGTPRRAPDDSPGPRPPAKAARPKATSGRAPAATKGGSAAPGRGDPRSAGTERWRQRNG
jgi:trimeric autotransporter adhesin